MAGKKGRSGGVRPNSGRKSKAEEQALAEKLAPMEADALKALHKGVKAGERWAITLYMNYAYGRPRQQKDITIDISRLTEDEAKTLIINHRKAINADV